MELWNNGICVWNNEIMILKNPKQLFIIYKFTINFNQNIYIKTPQKSRIFYNIF